MVARGESPAFIATPTMSAELTYARLRVLKAIEQTGFPPSNTRADMLRRMQEAGLIGPMAGSEPWRTTKHGAKAMREADAQEGCRLLAAACNRILA
jgi:hypothetical protein